MAQYELTTKQKAEVRKTGHVNITRNGKQVRVTPSMVKKASPSPAKRATRGKVKAKGKGRKGGYEDLVAKEKAQAYARMQAAGVNPRSAGAWSRTLTIERARAAAAAAKTTTTKAAAPVTVITAAAPAPAAKTTLPAGVINAATTPGNTTGMKVSAKTVRPKYYVRGYSRTGQPLYAPIGPQQIGEAVYTYNDRFVTVPIWQSPFTEKPVIGANANQAIGIDVAKRGIGSDVKFSINYY